MSSAFSPFSNGAGLPAEAFCGLPWRPCRNLQGVSNCRDVVPEVAAYLNTARAGCPALGYNSFRSELCGNTHQLVELVSNPELMCGFIRCLAKRCGRCRNLRTRDIFGWPICHGKNYISCQCVHTFTWLQRRWRQSLSANDLAMLVPSCRTPPPKQDS